MAVPFRRLRLSLVLLSQLLAIPAGLAGGTVEFEAGNGEDRQRLQFEFDGDKLRMSPVRKKGSDDPDAYSVFRDGKMYSVVDNDGEKMVLDMGSMMKMMGGAMAKSAQFDTGLDDIAEYHSLTATGRSETHAGITGEVYTVDYTTRAGRREKSEMVLAKNATLVEMSSAMTAFSEMMAKAMGQAADKPGSKALEAEFRNKKLGLLRVEQDLRVVRVDTATPPAARFKLPAAPIEMPAMPAGMEGLFGGAAAAGSEGEGERAAAPAVLDEKVQRQKDRVKQRTEEEADNAADRTVDKALNKAFDKIFGR